MGNRRHSHKETGVAGRGLGPRDTHATPAKLPVRGQEGRVELGWRIPQGHPFTARKSEDIGLRADLQGEVQFLSNSLTALWL